jgi:phospholipid-transporting ATPase
LFSVAIARLDIDLMNLYRLCVCVQNLYLQFNKKANLYFLFIAILSLFPLSPKPWWVSVLPLLFVLAVSAVKEAIEDFNRYRQDEMINATKVLAWRNNAFELIQWKHIVVGDVLKVVENSAFPADMVLLQSSLAQGICNIETANLDGFVCLFTSTLCVTSIHLSVTMLSARRT